MEVKWLQVRLGTSHTHAGYLVGKLRARPRKPQYSLLGSEVIFWTLRAKQNLKWACRKECSILGEGNTLTKVVPARHDLTRSSQPTRTYTEANTNRNMHWHACACTLCSCSLPLKPMSIACCTSLLSGWRGKVRREDIRAETKMAVFSLAQIPFTWSN